MRKLQCTGNNSRGRALPGIMGMSRTFWLARAMTLLVIAGVKGKAQTSKPSSVSVSSTTRQGTSSPDLSPLCSCPSCFRSWIQLLMQPFYLSRTSPMSTCLLQIKHAVPDSSDLLQMFCFPSSSASSKVKLIHPDLKKPDMVSYSIFVYNF